MKPADAFGTGALGPAIVVGVGLVLLAYAFMRRLRQATAVPV